MDSTSPSLMERLRQPNQPRAWERFVDLYTPLLLYWGRRIGLGPDDARDLVQEVLAALVRKMPEFRYDPGRSFRSWLRTVAMNKWRDGRRRGGVVAQADGLSGVADENAVEQMWEAEHRRHLVRRALEIMKAEFEETTWRACWEFVVNERSAAEIAAELKLSENAVYIAKSRVLRRLREELAGLLE